MATDDNRAIALIEGKQAFKAAVEALKQAYEEATPEAQEHIQQAYEHVKLMRAHLGEQNKAIQQALVTVQAAQAALAELTNQRDAVIEELHEIVTRLMSGKAHELLNASGQHLPEELADAIDDLHYTAHNMAQDKLVERMVEVMGDQWTKYSARDIVHLLSEENHMDYSGAEVEAFRALLRQLFDQLVNGDLAKYATE